MTATDRCGDWVVEGRKLEAAATKGPWLAGVDDWDGAYVRMPLDGFGVAYIASHMSQGRSEGEDDAAWIADARTRLPCALRALEAVLTLHAPLDVEACDGMSVQVCGQCHATVLDVIDEAFDGDHYGPVLWPCPTIVAITEVSDA